MDIVQQLCIYVCVVFITHVCMYIYIYIYIYIAQQVRYIYSHVLFNRISIQDITDLGSFQCSPSHPGCGVYLEWDVVSFVTVSHNTVSCKQYLVYQELVCSK